MLKILDHAWHQAHSYRLHALPAQFWYLLVGYRTWDESSRPIPRNFRGFVWPIGQLLDFDLIISHVDNWCDTRYPFRALPYRMLNLLAARHYPDVTRVAIMHGSPDNDRNKEAIVNLLSVTAGGAPFMVCNSHQACREWGLGPARSRTIIHGYDVDEFRSSKTRRKQVITVCSGGAMSRTYHGIPLLERIRFDVPVTWIGSRGDFDWFPSYAEYRDYLSTALIYLHTGQRSPMPGARTEAMLSGCCIVTTSNHDAQSFIEHGHTGFIADTAEELIDILRSLLADPRRAYKVGKQGREMARERFNKKRYIGDWLTLIDDLGNG